MLFRSQFALTDNSKPTAATAQKFLEDVHAELEGILRNLGYVVPIVKAVSPAGYVQVRAAECLGAAARILYARAAGVGGEASVLSADRMQGQFDKIIEGWNDKKNPRELTDVPRTSNQIEKPQHVMAASASTISEIDEADGPRCYMGQIF